MTKIKHTYIKPTDTTISLGDKEILCVPVRELEYEDAKKEIIKYIERVGRKVYISEIVENLWLDIEMIEQILEELNMHKNEE